MVGAYEQLTAEGFLISRHGQSTCVAEVHRSPTSAIDDNPFGPSPRWDFRPGAPDAGAFPRTQWGRSIRRVLNEAPDEAFDYPDPRGRRELRASLAAHLGRTRSVRTDPAGVHVHGGFAASLGFIAEALRRLGHQTIAIESAMLEPHRQILRGAGLDVIAIPVDDDGLVVDELVGHNVRAVLCTPANQYPHGVTLSAPRRADLVGWAALADGWIIEDDYDGEFRYDGRPIGALQGLDPSRVIYCGTASKSLGAGLRLSWTIAPAEFRAPLQRVTHLRAGVSAIDQLALADLISRGDLDRHVRLMRRRYRKRQQSLVALLESVAPQLRIGPTTAGLHMVGFLPPGVTEARVLRSADAASIGLLGLQTHHRSPDAPPALVIGFGRLRDHDVHEALDRLGQLLANELR